MAAPEVKRRYCFDTMSFVESVGGREAEKTLRLYNAGVGGRDCGHIDVYRSVVTKDNLTLTVTMRRGGEQIIGHLSFNPAQLRKLRDRITEALRESVLIEEYE